MKFVSYNILELGIFISVAIISESHGDHFENDIVNLVKYAESVMEEKPFEKKEYFSPLPEYEQSEDFDSRTLTIDSPTNPIVQTTSGEVEGITTDDAHVFYNIPYAEPPEGSLRFKSPVPLQSATRKINATVNSGVYCSQYRSSCRNLTECTKNIKEDCLILNIYTPLSVDLSQGSTSQNDQLNVMFYIHGGSFLHLASTTPTLEGRWLARETNHVIVSINYRLGPWGFLAFDDGVNVITGKQGMEDQLLALKWVNENIASFGGNPDSITIFGNSAGAQSCMLHLLWDESAPYFHRAIMQSNPAVFPYPTAEEAYVITNKVIKYLGCNETQEYECLMNTPAHEINNLEPRIVTSSFLAEDFWNMIENFRPVMGFSDQPLALFRDGIWHSDKQVILGTNTGECDQAQEVLKYLPNQLSYDLYRTTNDILMGSKSLGEKVSLQYADWYANDTGFARAVSEEITHLLFNCPTRALARFASATTSGDGAVYLYSFAHPREGEICVQSPTIECGYATHASERKYVFRTGPYIGFPFSADDYAVADQFTSYWGQFSKLGDPSPDTTSANAFYDWQLYSGSNPNSIYENVIVDAPESTGETNYRSEVCDFWDSLDFYVDMPKVPTEKPITTTKGNGVDTEEPDPTTLAMVESTTSGANNVKLATSSMLVVIFSFIYFYNNLI